MGEWHNVAPRSLQIAYEASHVLVRPHPLSVRLSPRCRILGTKPPRLWARSTILTLATRAPHTTGQFALHTSNSRRGTSSQSIRRLAQSPPLNTQSLHWVVVKFPVWILLCQSSRQEESDADYLRLFSPYLIWYRFMLLLYEGAWCCIPLNYDPSSLDLATSQCLVICSRDFCSLKALLPRLSNIPVTVITTPSGRRSKALIPKFSIVYRALPGHFVMKVRPAHQRHLPHPHV